MSKKMISTQCIVMGEQDVFETCFEVLSQNISKEANENCEYIFRFDIHVSMPHDTMS